MISFIFQIYLFMIAVFFIFAFLFLHDCSIYQLFISHRNVLSILNIGQHNGNLFMGAICTKKEELQSYQKQNSQSTCSITNKERVKFCVDPNDILSSECLILFTDNKHDLQKNEFLKKLDPKFAYYINSCFKVHLANLSKFGFGQSMIFPLRKDEQIQIKQVCIICLKVWKEQFHSEDQMKGIILAALDKIKEKKIRDISFSPLDDSLLGIPSDVAAKALCRTLCNIDYFDNILICTKDEENLERVSVEYERKTRIKLEMGQSQTEKSVTEKDKSTYF